MKTVFTTALAGLYLFIAPVFSHLAAQSPGEQRAFHSNETVVFKNSTWPLRKTSIGAAITYFDI